MTEFIYKYRWIIFSLSLLLGVGSIILIPASKIDPEMENYIPAKMKSRVETDMIEKEFGVQDMVLILFSDKNILNNDNLLRIKNIDRSISKINGVMTRISPFTVRSIRNEEGMMISEPLIKEIPSDSAGMFRLTHDILNNTFARDIVVSSDLTTASITATISDSDSEIRTLERIDSIVAAYPGTAQVRKGGLPYIRQNIMKDVSRDAVVLVPLALIIMLFVLKTTLGSWRSVIMPFSVVVISTAASIALIPLFGWKISILSLLVPIILIAVANNYGIYLVSRFQEIKLQNNHLDSREIIKSLLKSLRMPILFSGLTTIAGILGLLTHAIIPARQVGILAATGVALALVLSLFLIPVFILIDNTHNGTRRKRGTDFLDRTISFTASFVIRHPGKILLSSLFLTIAVSSGIFLLKINSNQESYFPRNHPVRQASDIINTKFGGSQTISVMIEGDIKDPAIMKGIDNLTRETRKLKGVGGVFSISQVVREMSKAIYTDGEDGYDQIPETREAIAQMFELYNMSGDPEDFKQLMDLENTKAHVLIRLSEPESHIIKSVRKRIEDLTSHVPAKITTGGYAIIMSDFADAIIKGQIRSLVFAVITVIILLAVIFKSLKGGLIGSIPLFASILILFGFMGYSGIALDAATALLSSLMIGVGVDFTIQYIWCFNSKLHDGMHYPEATEAAMKTIGRSIIINGLGVMTGFSALIFSGFTSIRFFGYLVLISIGSCLAGAMIVIPAFLLKFRPGLMKFQFSKIKRRKDEKDIDFIGVTTAAFSDKGPAA